MMTTRDANANEAVRRLVGLVVAGGFWLYIGELCVAQSMPHLGVPNVAAMQQNAGVPMNYGDVQAPIRQIQNTANSDKPLPGPIAAMPTIQEEMEVIHRRSQLILSRMNIVRMAIADPSVLDVVQYGPAEISVVGLNEGSTTLHLWFENDPEPLIYLVRVIPDPSLEEQRRVDYGKLERKLAVLFPNSKVYLIPLSRKIIVKGQAADSEEAARILSIVRGEVINQFGSLGGPQPGANGVNGINDINDITGIGNYSSLIVNMLKVPGEYQIMLHVQIAELNRSMLRTMGVDWDVVFANGRQFIASSIGGAGAGTLSGIFENGEINVVLNWLASNGTAKILTEPTLTVLSGHSASFLSGGEFAVPTIVGIGGASGQTTTFRGFGTSVIVTPTIIDRDLIRLQIVPEFSSINGNNSVGGIPGVDSRRVQTTVELREGQTIALAGLLSSQTNTEITRIPLLGELPIVGGPIFNTKRSSLDETELLILVTPEIVRPMDPDEVPPMPGFNVTHPNDVELYKYAMLEGAPDTRVYQLAPYGHGSGVGMEVGYRPFDPAPAGNMYSPATTNPYGAQAPYGGQGPGPGPMGGPPMNGGPQFNGGRYGGPGAGQMYPTPDPTMGANFRGVYGNPPYGQPNGAMNPMMNGHSRNPGGMGNGAIQPAGYQQWNGQNSGGSRNILNLPWFGKGRNPPNR